MNYKVQGFEKKKPNEMLNMPMDNLETSYQKGIH